MAVTAPVLVNPPPLTPPRFGLLSVADLIDDPNPHWVGGVEYDAHPVPAALVGTVDVCPDDPESDRNPGGGVDTVIDGAFRAWAGHACKLPGTSRADIADRARAVLTAGEGPALERAIWHDGEHPLLSSSTHLPADDGALSVTASIGALEEWLWEAYSGLGVLHVPRSAVPALVAVNQIGVDGGKLRTLLGTPVAAGAYPGSGPDKTAAATGQVWVAATAAVHYRRSQITVREGFEHTTNTAAAIAERYWLPSWEALSAAVLMKTEA